MFIVDNICTKGESAACTKHHKNFVTTFSIAMFHSQALKTHGNTPKYGLIFHSSFIVRAGSKNKGRISRYLANKCSIASRIDCFYGKMCTNICINYMTSSPYCNLLWLSCLHVPYSNTQGNIVLRFLLLFLTRGLHVECSDSFKKHSVFVNHIVFLWYGGFV